VTRPAARLWCSAAFGLPLALSRHYARAPRGERAAVVEAFETGGNISVISALPLAGVRAPRRIEGAFAGEGLELDVLPLLAPQLRAGDSVIWDYIPTPKTAGY